MLPVPLSVNHESLRDSFVPMYRNRRSVGRKTGVRLVLDLLREGGIVLTKTYRTSTADISFGQPVVEDNSRPIREMSVG